jgi:hypothetical protein
MLMDDKDDVELLTEDLLEEFKKLGKDYPLITKMFMDMVAIVSEHNSRLEGLVEIGEGAISDLAQAFTILKEHEKKIDILKDNFLVDASAPQFPREDDFSLMALAFRNRKKDDILN